MKVYLYKTKEPKARFALTLVKRGIKYRTHTASIDSYRREESITEALQIMQKFLSDKEVGERTWKKPHPKGDLIKYN